MQTEVMHTYYAYYYCTLKMHLTHFKCVEIQDNFAMLKNGEKRATF